jgi:hypothetical protein
MIQTKKGPSWEPGILDLVSVNNCASHESVLPNRYRSGFRVGRLGDVSCTMTRVL